MKDSLACGKIISFSWYIYIKEMLLFRLLIRYWKAWMLSLNPGSPAAEPHTLSTASNGLLPISDPWGCRARAFSNHEAIGSCAHPRYLVNLDDRLSSSARCYQGQSQPGVIWDEVVLKTAFILSPGGSCSEEDLSSWDKDPWWSLAFVRLHLKT